MPRWTAHTPDGRRLIVSRRPDGWSVARGESVFGPRDRLDAVLIEALLLDGDVVPHAMRSEYAAWSWQLSDQIERGTLRPDDEG